MCALFIGIREVVQNILRPLALVGANRVLGFGLVAQGGRRSLEGVLGQSTVQGSATRCTPLLPPLYCATLLIMVQQIIDGANCQMVDNRLRAS